MPTSSWANAPWNDPSRAVSERRYGRTQMLTIAGGCALVGVAGGTLLGWNLSSHRTSAPAPAPTVTATATATAQTTVTATPKPTPASTFQGIKCAVAGKNVQLSGAAQVHGQAGTALLQIGGWSTTTSWPAGHPSITVKINHAGKKGDACSATMVGGRWQGRAA